MAPTAPLLDMRDIDKRFLGVHALASASLEVAPGEIMALVGQNGAGKSTLIKVLTGAYRRDAGSIALGGEPIDFASPQAAQRGGVSTIYQEINLVPFRSVAENIFLGREHRRYGLLDWGRMNAEAAALLRRFAVEIDVRRPLMDFSTAIQQMVAIARAVSFKAQLVIMDEPTSSLDEREVAVLFDVMRQLRAEGVAVIFITHRLDELYQVCDRVTVMRDGRTVMTSRMGEVDKLHLISAMLGRDLETVRATQPAFPPPRRKREMKCCRRKVCKSDAGCATRGSKSGPARSSGSPGSSARAGPKRRGRSSAPTRRTRARSVCWERSCRRASPPTRSRSASAIAARTARPTASSPTCRCARTSPSPSCRASSRWASSTRPASARSSTGSWRAWRSRPRASSRRSAISPAATSRRCCSRAGCAPIRGC